MKYFLLLSFSIFLNWANASAAITTTYADSSVNKSSYKQSKQYFLDNYGKDDSTRALINYFFKRRKEAFYETVVPPVAAGVSLLLLNLILSNQANVKEDTGGAGLMVVLSAVVTLYGSAGTLIDGQIKWLVFNRKKLLTVLTDYHSGKPLPKKIKRRNAFKYELKYPR